MKVSLFSLLILTVSLTACMHNRTDDYVNAQSIPPLKAPAGVQQPNFKESYPIPSKATPDIEPAPSLVPPGLADDEEAAKIALTEKKETT